MVLVHFISFAQYLLKTEVDNSDICVDLNKGCPEKLCDVINHAEMRMTDK